MVEIVSGYRKFRSEVFPQRREDFQRLAKGQDPQMLFITCSDSRIVPEMLMQSGPGELFICRNAGNVVPAHGDHTGGVSATIEYAVRALEVPDIVVCGHSDCGVMRSLLNPERVKHMTAVSSWLLYGERARQIVEEVHHELSEDDKAWELAKQNVLAQLDHLKTHPCVAAALTKGKVRLHGWVYRIHTGEVFAWSGRGNEFTPLEETARGEDSSSTSAA